MRFPFPLPHSCCIASSSQSTLQLLPSLLYSAVSFSGCIPFEHIILDQILHILTLPVPKITCTLTDVQRNFIQNKITRFATFGEKRRELPKSSYPMVLAPVEGPAGVLGRAGDVHPILHSAVLADQRNGGSYATPVAQRRQ
jgi:hypothetical protein